MFRKRKQRDEFFVIEFIKNLFVQRQIKRMNNENNLEKYAACD